MTATSVKADAGVSHTAADVSDSEASVDDSKQLCDHRSTHTHIISLSDQLNLGSSFAPF